MSGTFSDTEAHSILGRYKTCWIGLHFDDPFTGGTTYFEITGDSYVRAAATFTEPASRTIWLDKTLVFSNLPQCTVSYIGAWTLQYNGSLLWRAEAPRDANGAIYKVKKGGSYKLVAGDIAIYLD